ncbi:SDR family oxidoreductase [Paenibacillus rhizoplanae]
MSPGLIVDSDCTLFALFLESKYMVFAGQYSPDQAALEALKAQYPDSLRLVPLDIGSAGSVKEAARSIAGSTGHLDMIINNAGIIHRSDDATVLVDMDDEAMAHIYNVNTLGGR